MKLWYEDEVTRLGLFEMGLGEVEKGYWASDRRHVQDFEGGIRFISHTVPGDSRFDVQTAFLGEERDHAFFVRGLRDHIDEIERRIEIVKEGGLEALLKLQPAAG